MTDDRSEEQLGERNHLVEVLERFVRGEASFPKFYDDFYFYYVDKLPEESLTEEDWEILWCDPREAGFSSHLARPIVRAVVMVGSPQRNFAAG